MKGSFIAPLAALAALLLFCSDVTSQAPQSQVSPTTRPVQLNLIVTDRSNHSVDEVRKEDLQLFEDKVLQTLSVFQKDERQVDYAIAIDTSGSFKNVLRPSLDAVRMVIKSNRPGDEAMLIRFVDNAKIETVHDFTSDQSALIDGLKYFRVEGGQSAVVDAIYVAVRAAAAHNAGDSTVRRAVVLISDGEDRNSYYNLDALVKLLRGTNVQVFIIGIVTQLDDSAGVIGTSQRAGAETLLKRVAQESGGRVFFPRNDDEIIRAAAEIVHDLHTQYLIGYESTNPNSKENFRKVEVKVVKPPGHPAHTAITRPGYFINPPDLSEQDKDKKKPKG